MMFNSKKFEVVRHGPDDVLKSTTSYTGPDGSIIPDRDHVRDLGVTMSNDCSFQQHISNICVSARNMCAWILRTFQSRSQELMLTTQRGSPLSSLSWTIALNFGVHPKLAKYRRSKISRDRSLERSGAKTEERLDSFKLYSLQRRRERYRIIYIWKILENLVPNIGADKIQSRCSIRHGRTCILPPRPSNNAPTYIKRLLEGSFCVNAVNLFNSIPKSIRNLSNVDTLTFKRKLDGFLTTIADEPQCPGYTARRRAASNSLTHMITACKH